MDQITFAVILDLEPSQPCRWRGREFHFVASQHPSTHRRLISPRQEPGSSACDGLCQRGQQAPNAPLAVRSRRSSPRRALLCADHIRGAWQAPHDCVVRAAAFQNVQRGVYCPVQRSANSQHAPKRFAPLTRRMPAARSGLRSPQSEASYASLRTAASLRLIVEGAYLRCSKAMR